MLSSGEGTPAERERERVNVCEGACLGASSIMQRGRRSTECSAAVMEQSRSGFLLTQTRRFHLSYIYADTFKYIKFR